MQNEAPPDDEGIEVEYVAETLDYKDPVYAQFASIFETFKVMVKYLPAFLELIDNCRVKISVN